MSSLIDCFDLGNKVLIDDSQIGYVVSRSVPKPIHNKKCLLIRFESGEERVISIDRLSIIQEQMITNINIIKQWLTQHILKLIRSTANLTMLADSLCLSEFDYSLIFDKIAQFGFETSETITDDMVINANYRLTSVNIDIPELKSFLTSNWSDLYRIITSNDKLINWLKESKIEFDQTINWTKFKLSLAKLIYQTKGDFYQYGLKSVMILQYKRLWQEFTFPIPPLEISLDTLFKNVKQCLFTLQSEELLVRHQMYQNGYLQWFDDLYNNKHLPFKLEDTRTKLKRLYVERKHQTLHRNRAYNNVTIQDLIIKNTLEQYQILLSQSNNDCGICCEVMGPPMLCQVCLNSICRDCYKSTENGRCPFCRTKYRSDYKDHDHDYDSESDYDSEYVSGSES